MRSKENGRRVARGVPGVMSTEQCCYRATVCRRTEMFMDAFNHISSHIDHIYKELTVKPGHMLGGTAFLTCAQLSAP